MSSTAGRKAIIAVDLGAQSCRISLLRWTTSGPSIHLVHRFANSPQSTSRGLRWDIDAVFHGIAHGVRMAGSAAPEGVASIGVDGWAVDYVRVNEAGEPVEQPYCYRDDRTEVAAARLHKVLPPSVLYSRTGIQILRINTLYQLYADRLAGCDPRVPWVNLPEYLSYRLCGRRVAEYTNATHTGLVALGSQRWCDNIFSDAGLDLAAAPPIVPTGTIIGTLHGELGSVAELRGCQIIVPACHDTASAVAAIPASGDDWAFISSGTWSLVGAVLPVPCITERARNLNFTNLGGVGGQVCFLKNVNGTWLLHQCLEEWIGSADEFSMTELLSSCESLPPPGCMIDVDDSDLLLPGGTIAKINAQLRHKGHKALATDKSHAPEFVNLILHSLAERYAEVLAAISGITERSLKRLFIVGGGSKNTLLNRLTAEKTGLQVIAGATESSTLGNFAVQLSVLDGGCTGMVGPSSDSVVRWTQVLMGDAVAAERQ